MEIITFTGGLGAQVLSAAAYFYLQSEGVPVGADLRYFRQSAHLATPGQPGDISQWAWQLQAYGLHPSDFDCMAPAGHRLIHDGERKGALGFLGLSLPHVQARFPLPQGVADLKRQLVGDRPFACLHLRRGDYLNVATFLESDDSSIKALRSVSRLVGDVVVVSDSPLSPELESGLSALGLNVTRVIGGDPVEAHGLMRLADVLIGANSQFSMTAAALRPLDRLTLCPSQHDGDRNSDANRMLAAIRSHQLITGFDVPQIRQAGQVTAPGGRVASIWRRIIRPRGGSFSS